MRVLIVDNFDSFTHNLAQVLGGLGADVLVRRNDAPAGALAAIGADRVVLSPGPGTPDRGGCCAALLEALPAAVPVLGVCLGMQIMAVACGGRVARAPRPVHGRATPLRHDGHGVFRTLPQDVVVGRYHSLQVLEASLPPDLTPSAWSDGVLMGLRHRARRWEGVQFHPESVLTVEGAVMLGNFLRD